MDYWKSSIAYVATNESIIQAHIHSHKIMGCGYAAI